MTPVIIVLVVVAAAAVLFGAQWLGKQLGKQLGQQLSQQLRQHLVQHLGGQKRQIADLQQRLAALESRPSIVTIASDEPVSGDDHEPRLQRLFMDEQMRAVGLLIRMLTLLQPGSHRAKALNVALEARQQALRVLGEREGMYGKTFDDIRTVGQVVRGLEEAIAVVHQDLDVRDRMTREIESARLQITMAGRREVNSEALQNAVTTLAAAEQMAEREDYENAIAAANNAYWLAVGTNAN